MITSQRSFYIGVMLRKGNVQFCTTLTLSPTNSLTNRRIGSEQNSSKSEDLRRVAPYESTEAFGPVLPACDGKCARTKHTVSRLFSALV
jgi:hypothetical protein